MLVRTLAATGILLFSASSSLADGAWFTVSVEPTLAASPLKGRLIVSVIRPGAKLAAGEDPNNAPFWDDPQPMFAADARFADATGEIEIDDVADHNFEKPTALKPGEYRAAARLIVAQQSSSWRNDAGNLFSDEVKFTVVADKPTQVKVKLARKTEARTWPAGDRSGGAELVEIRSKLLSEFHKREVMLRAGVVKPDNFDSKRTYAAVYEVPGFGGDHFEAISVARRRSARPGRVSPALPPALGDESQLTAQVFWIVLDPESPNGHTLFADSANNGPCGRALVEELIPEIEKRYPLATKPEARLVRGHSSGGWSSIWLAMNYPETFGAAWSSSPDPVDFRRFQLINIYKFAAMYDTGRVVVREGIDPIAALRAIPGALSPGAGGDADFDFASYRRGDRPVMTVRAEARGEDVLGSDNTSGQQWDSWFAVFGPRNDRGHPTALFDPITGQIDQAVAEYYRKYDISHLLTTEPDKYGGRFQNNIRIVVGGADNFFLNEAVALLKEDVDKLPTGTPPPARPGYIKIVPGLDHGSIFGSPELRAFPTQMLAHLRACGMAPFPVNPEVAPDEHRTK